MQALRATRAAERGLGAVLAALLLSGAGAAPSSVTVTREGDRLDLEAQATPLSEVLDALAAELGVSVEYEGTPPRLPVTLALQDRTPAEAVLSLLDGTGVDYALQLDASGQGVVRLLIQAPSGSRPARAAPQRPRPTPTRRAAPMPTPPPVPEFPQPFDPAADPDQQQQDGEPSAGADPSEGMPRPLTFPTPRPGRPAPAPLLFPEPLLPATPTPTPPPEQQQP